MRLAFAVVLSFACSACVHGKTMESEGLTPEILLTMETEDWGVKRGVVEWPDWAKSMRVPESARPTAVKNVNCSWNSGLELFACEYDVDWKADGGVTGTYRQRFVNVGKENGIWSNDYIVVS